MPCHCLLLLETAFSNSVVCLCPGHNLPLGAISRILFAPGVKATFLFVPQVKHDCPASFPPPSHPFAVFVPLMDPSSATLGFCRAQERVRTWDTTPSCLSRSCSTSGIQGFPCLGHRDGGFPHGTLAALSSPGQKEEAGRV